MWWLLHIVAVILIFCLGYVVGKASGDPDGPEDSGWKSDIGNESRNDSPAGKSETR